MRQLMEKSSKRNIILDKLKTTVCCVYWSDIGIYWTDAVEINKKTVFRNKKELYSALHKELFDKYIKYLVIKIETFNKIKHVYYYKEQ